MAMMAGQGTGPDPEVGEPSRLPVELSITQDVGFGNEVFVQGDHPDLSSGGILSRGVKLHWTPGHVWKATVAIEVGATVRFRYFSLPGDRIGFCEAEATPLSGEECLTVKVGPPLPLRGKTITYRSGWDRAVLLYRDTSVDGAWTEAEMRRTGEGRSPDEAIFEVTGIAAAGNEIEFVFHNGEGAFDNAPAPPSEPAQGAAPAVPAPYQSLSVPFNYRTRLDFLTVQDGKVFNGEPPPFVSGSRIMEVFVNSTVGEVPGRPVRVYLPRGYEENPDKRYPVVYFHDGQNVFFPGGASGTWDAGRIADYEIAMGRMCEAILVAVDNADDHGSSRTVEYIPSQDVLTGDGRADDYLQFLLDNVMPAIDHDFRTQTGPEETVVAGSSLGGLVTAYMGVAQPERFGNLGIFSPAFWAGDEFVSGALAAAGKLPLRIYLDIGTRESSSGLADSDAYWQDAVGVYNQWLSDGYVVNDELLFFSECGAVHNEAAWSRRLPAFFQFILDPRRQANGLHAGRIALRPVITDLDPSTGSGQLNVTLPRGQVLRLWGGPSPDEMSDIGVVGPADEVWENVAVPLTFSPQAGRYFWEVRWE